MMQPEILQSPWSFYEEDMMDSSTFDQVADTYGFTTVDHVGDCGSGTYGIIMDDDHVGDCGFSILLSTSENTASEVFSIPFPNSTMFTNDHIQYPIDEETLQLPSLMELDAFDSILSPPHIAGIQGYQEESEGSFPNSQNFPSVVEDAWSPTLSELSSIQQPPLTLPQEDMEIDNQVSLPHLMEACGEALEQGQKELAEVILRCMSQKVSPLGEPLERLAFYLSQEMTNHGDYLKGEASKNFEAALRAFYQGNPIGKVAHFAAISAIVEAISVDSDCDAIHIIDFCLGHGIQWPPLFEAICHLNKTLKLTSIKWGDESPECVSTPWNFEETRRQLYEHAKSCGLKLQVEEKGLEELVTEIKIKIMNKRGVRRELLAFNCMVGLPHMAMVRSRRRHALEFLKVAEDLINSSGSKGIITFGDGDAFERLKNSLNFRSFFEGQLVHYQALLESIESHFTARFSEARASSEVLFVAPCISSLGWFQTWEEMKSDCHLQAEISIEGCRLSKNILMEVRGVLRGSEGSSYQARIEGQNDNELVLEWKGTQLLRFSIWKN